MTSKIIETVARRTAIITGGSRGMGRNTAVNLARHGVDVIFTYHSNQTKAESLIREIEAMGRKAEAHRLDTGALGAFDGFVADVRKALTSWGRERFDYLVNNAGNSQHIDFDKVTSPFAFPLYSREWTLSTKFRDLYLLYQTSRHFL